MHGEDRPNIKTQLIIGALKFAKFPDHISIDYDPRLNISQVEVLNLALYMLVKSARKTMHALFLCVKYVNSSFITRNHLKLT